jgi:hypothetical protein
MKRYKIDIILEAFQSGEHLTHLKALAYNTHRLAHFVNVLRKRGWNIISTERIDHGGTKYTEYHMPAGRPRLAA